MRAIILTKAHRAAVSMMAKGCIVARVLVLRCFLFLLPNYINILVYLFYLTFLLTSLKYSFLNTSKQQYFSAAHFRMVVKCPMFSQ